MLAVAFTPELRNLTAFGPRLPLFPQAAQHPGDLPARQSLSYGVLG
jgi:hypothetical protein